MKLLKATLFILFLAQVIPPLEYAPPVSGILPYTQYPCDVTKPVRISFVYHTTIDMTLEYEYYVRNPAGEVVVTRPKRQILLNKGEELPLHYSSYSGATGVGRNALVFMHRPLGETSYKTHTIYFYGYRPGVEVDLNNKADRDAKFSEETVFVYNGYVAGTVRFIKTSIYSSGLIEELLLAHDLFLNLETLFIRTNADYENVDKMFDDARLYITNHSLFPYHLQSFDHEAVLHLKLIKNDYIISFHPKTIVYYDPVTHLTCMAYKKGFLQSTKYLFPKGRKHDIEAADYRLEIKGFGFNKFNVTFRFKVKILDVYVGEDGYHEVRIERN